MTDYHWKLDEATGTTAVDSLQATVGTLVGFAEPADWMPGRVGGALAFAQGDSQQIEIPSTVLNGATNWSLALWIQSGDSLSYPRLFSGVHAGQANELVLELSPSSTLIVRYRGANLTWLLANARDGGWHHVTVTFDASTNSTHVWLDGVSQGAKTMAGAVAQSLAFDAPCYLGNWAGGPTAARSWYGLMDEVFISSRVLSSIEIQSLSHPSHTVRGGALSAGLASGMIAVVHPSTSFTPQAVLAVSQIKRYIRI